MLKNIVYFIGFILLFASFSNADVPPQRGEIRVQPPLVLTATDDFTEYRFFFLSPSEVEEIQIKKDETKTLSSENRGGANRSGSLYAVKKSVLDKDSFKITENRDATRNLFQKIIESNKNDSIELLKHSFREDISASERVNWKYPTYQIEKSGDTIKVVVKNEIAEKLSEEEEQLINNSSNFFMIIAGILVAFAVVTLGIILFRRS
jgi:hypothetical protein